MTWVLKDNRFAYFGLLCAVVHLSFRMMLRSLPFVLLLSCCLSFLFILETNISAPSS
jgi:hypothetical protein